MKRFSLLSHFGCVCVCSIKRFPIFNGVCECLVDGQQVVYSMPTTEAHCTNAAIKYRFGRLKFIHIPSIHWFNSSVADIFARTSCSIAFNLGYSLISFHFNIIICDLLFVCVCGVPNAGAFRSFIFLVFAGAAHWIVLVVVFGLGMCCVVFRCYISIVHISLSLPIALLSILGILLAFGCCWLANGIWETFQKLHSHFVFVLLLLSVYFNLFHLLFIAGASIIFLCVAAARTLCTLFPLFLFLRNIYFLGVVSFLRCFHFCCGTTKINIHMHTRNKYIYGSSSSSQQSIALLAMTTWHYIYDSQMLKKMNNKPKHDK